MPNNLIVKGGTKHMCGGGYYGGNINDERTPEQLALFDINNQQNDITGTMSNRIMPIVEDILTELNIDNDYLENLLVDTLFFYILDFLGWGNLTDEQRDDYDLQNLYNSYQNITADTIINDLAQYLEIKLNEPGADAEAFTNGNLILNQNPLFQFLVGYLFLILRRVMPDNEDVFQYTIQDRDFPTNPNDAFHSLVVLGDEDYIEDDPVSATEARIMGQQLLAQRPNITLNLFQNPQQGGGHCFMKC